jgi:cell wall-associated NlpC family hydrolase
LRLRFLIAIGWTLIVPAAWASNALAASTGGVAPTSTTSTGTTTTTAPATTLHLDPVTSRSRSVAYKGPVYEKTATGAVVPYTPNLVSSTPANTAAAAASATGGAAPTSTSSPTTVPPAAAITGPTPRPDLLVPGTTARYVNGLAAAPMNVPVQIQKMIWAGNELIGLPYIFGGGHQSFISSGYDCSGTVSYALHAAGFLSTPQDSSEMMVTGSHGIGRYVAVFANPGHAYMTVAGLRLDTSSADDPSNQQGPRWRPLRVSNSGYTVRHPLGF